MADPDISGARRAARGIIAEYGITDPCGICLPDIAFARNVIVREEELIGAEGRLLRQGSWGVVRVRRNAAYPGRTRFSIGHELGHWERHMRISQAWLCSSREIHAYSGSAAELEANAFAGELLMPATMLKPRIHSGLGMKMLCDLADEFKTSLTATAVRAIQETDEDAYVIFSQEGVIQWCSRSRRADRFIPRGFCTRDNSHALDCRNTPENSCGMQEVDTDAWFDHRHGDERIDVWEESVCFPDLGTVMTLLSLA